ncbi:hypothetical protein HPB51_018317 [Rhipicephalus microplus]|uniref:Uncharacterized protein n=1 Tax=Rhipicephalus microplus TaxID=6941 RepID=A0A9J6DAT8_RHIMP|nr:hypothetical protein HPB51_018317 [Rhipicephalus microplus]
MVMTYEFPLLIGGSEACKTCPLIVFSKDLLTILVTTIAVYYVTTTYVDASQIELASCDTAGQNAEFLRFIPGVANFPAVNATLCNHLVTLEDSTVTKPENALPENGCPMAEKTNACGSCEVYCAKTKYGLSEMFNSEEVTT